MTSPRKTTPEHKLSETDEKDPLYYHPDAHPNPELLPNFYQSTNIFVLFGAHRNSPTTQSKIAKLLEATAKEYKPDFVLLLGDNLYSNPRPNPRDLGDGSERIYQAPVKPK